jgi:Nucleotide-diphospho-sugar transferase
MNPAPAAPCGIIYLVSGGRSYLGELITSLKSLRRHEPCLPVTVYSRFAVPAGLRAEWVPLDSREHPLKLKVLALRRSPYERTLFLDTDITIRGPLREVFGNLDTHDFCAANSHEADWSVKPPRFVTMVKPGDHNTGVLLYRKSEAMLQFLDRWEQAVLAQDPADMWAGHNCDQHHFNTLVRAGALPSCGVDFHELDNVIYNCRGVMLDAVKAAGRESDIRIFHHRTRAMKLRKLFYSATDPATAKELLRKCARRLGLGGR